MLLRKAIFAERQQGGKPNDDDRAVSNFDVCVNVNYWTVCVF